MKYDNDLIVEALRLYQLGYSKRNIAKKLGVSRATVVNWIKNKSQNPTFKKRGRKELVISPIDLQKIEIMRNSGNSLSTIASALSISKTKIWKILNKIT